MIEDPNPPPEYTPIALDGQEGFTPSADFEVLEANEKPITSSLRTTHRLLYISGWHGYTRGIGCAMFTGFCTAMLAGFVTLHTPLPHFVGSFIATLVFTQLSTAWVHIVITTPSTRSWFRRTLPFRFVFRATALPLLAHWAASVASIELPRLMAIVLGLQNFMPGGQVDRPDVVINLPRLLLKGTPVAALAIFLYLFAVIPAQVILRRVQASLLPPTEDTIIPFDRSFKGKLDPAVLGGGSETFLTMRDALTTFGREGWKRLVKMILKVMALTVALQVVIVGTFGLEMLIFSWAFKK